MSKHRLTTEHLLYAAAVGLALTVRLWGLGRAPLGAHEAAVALTALKVAARHAAPLGAAPLLTALTGLAFFLLGSTDAVARLVPALLGGLLPLLAWPLRRGVGRKAALLLAFALALDPGLVALSRLANSPVPAVLALLSAVLAAAHARWDWALPLALLGLFLGPTFWFGALALLLAAALYRALGFPLATVLPPDRLRQGMRNAVIAAVLGSTLVFWTPEGLGAWFNGLSAFVHTFVPLKPVPLQLLTVALPAYAPLATGAAIVGAVLLRKQKNPAAAFALVATLSALVLAVLLPTHEVSLLVWALPPLWALAAWALVQLPLGHPADTAWQAALTLALLTFAWFSLLAWSRAPAGSRQAALQLGLLVVSLLLVPLLTALLAFSRAESRRSWQEALLGPAWGLVAAGTLLTLSAFSRAAYGPRPAELWDIAATAPQERLLERTLTDLSQQRHGLPNTLEVTAVAPQENELAPTLHWMLHNNPNAHFAEALSPDAQPEAIITFSNKPPATATAYRGEGFPLMLTPPLPLAGIRGVIQWLAFRPPQPQATEAVLWVRADLFPNTSSSLNMEPRKP